MNSRPYDLEYHMLNVERIKLPARNEIKAKLPLKIREVALDLNGTPALR